MVLFLEEYLAIFSVSQFKNMIEIRCIAYSKNTLALLFP